MVALHITTLPPGTFYRWMKAQGKLGDRHKVPPVTNDRKVAATLLVLAAEEARPLVDPVTA